MGRSPGAGAVAIAAGRLRERAAIQLRVQTEDLYGQRVESWETLATVWAAVEPSRGREFWAARQVLDEATCRILIRHRTDVSTLNRVVAGGVAYDILSVVSPELRHEFLELYCREARP